MARNYPLLLAHRSSDRILVEEGTAQVVVPHSFDKLVVRRTGPEEVDSRAGEEDSLPVEADNLDRSRVAGSPVGRTDRRDLT